MQLISRQQYDNEPTLEFISSAPEGSARNYAFRTDGTAKLFIQGNGNIGISTTTPKAKLQVADGDIYIEDARSGVVMTSPNGQCWRMTIDNTGQTEVNSMTCPR